MDIANNNNDDDGDGFDVVDTQFIYIYIHMCFLIHKDKIRAHGITLIYGYTCEMTLCCFYVFTGKKKKRL